MEGKRFNLIKKYINFMGHYYNCKIQYCFKKLQSDCEIKKKEECLLKCYLKKFGEVLPLNHNLPKKHEIDMESLDCD